MHAVRHMDGKASCECMAKGHTCCLHVQQSLAGTNGSAHDHGHATWHATMLSIDGFSKRVLQRISCTIYSYLAGASCE